MGTVTWTCFSKVSQLLPDLFTSDFICFNSSCIALRRKTLKSQAFIHLRSFEKKKKLLSLFYGRNSQKIHKTILTCKFFDLVALSFQKFSEKGVFRIGTHYHIGTAQQVIICRNRVLKSKTNQEKSEVYIYCILAD